jgi:hypothetical protein
MKVLLKQIGSHWHSFLTVRRDRAMFGALSGDAQDGKRKERMCILDGYQKRLPTAIPLF